ncbi:hypothetical protein FB451DRAFT_1408358 [Mycena latifolia]|nr:hypothetical protein FB451DRAFT_1408358 [Mycena latifolia]
MRSVFGLDVFGKQRPDLDGLHVDVLALTGPVVTVAGRSRSAGSSRLTSASPLRSRGALTFADVLGIEWDLRKPMFRFRFRDLHELKHLSLHPTVDTAKKTSVRPYSFRTRSGLQHRAAGLRRTDDLVKRDAGRRQDYIAHLALRNPRLALTRRVATLTHMMRFPPLCIPGVGLPSTLRATRLGCGALVELGAGPAWQGSRLPLFEAARHLAAAHPRLALMRAEALVPGQHLAIHRRTTLVKRGDRPLHRDAEGLRSSLPDLSLPTSRPRPPRALFRAQYVTRAAAGAYILASAGHGALLQAPRRADGVCRAFFLASYPGSPRSTAGGHSSRACNVWLRRTRGSRY